MSMFLCARCDRLKDSDDGGEVYGPTGTAMICVECAADLEDDADTYHTSSTPAEETARVHRMRADMSYKNIHETLTKAGCPEDLAHELAREKSRG